MMSYWGERHACDSRQWKSRCLREAMTAFKLEKPMMLQYDIVKQHRRIVDNSQIMGGVCRSCFYVLEREGGGKVNFSRSTTYCTRTISNTLSQIEKEHDLTAISVTSFLFANAI